MEWKRWKLTQKAMAFRILYLSGSNMSLFIEITPSSTSDLTPDLDLLKSEFFGVKNPLSAYIQANTSSDSVQLE